jgi:hypothetical protein
VSGLKVILFQACDGAPRQKKVQVKSKTGNVDLKDYVALFEGMQGYDRMFFIWHSGSVRMDAPPPGVTLIGPEALARTVLDAGLYSWLKARVS